MRSVLQTIYPFSFSNLFLDIAWILSLNANPILKDILFKIVLCFNRIKSSIYSLKYYCYTRTIQKRIEVKIHMMTQQDSLY